MSLQETPRTHASVRAETIERRKRLGILSLQPVSRFVPTPPIDAVPGPITLQRIIAMVSEEFNVTVRQIRNPCRAAAYVTARHAISYLARELTVHSYLRIANSIYRSDHTSIVWGERRAKARMLVDHEFALSVVTIERRLVESAARYVMADLIVIDGKPVDHIECPHCQRVVFEAKRGA